MLRELDFVICVYFVICVRTYMSLSVVVQVHSPLSVKFAVLSRTSLKQLITIVYLAQ